MRKIELDVVALTHSVTSSHNYAVILGEVNGERKLPVVIGGFEAQAIAVAMEKMIPNRPLTHDLFKNTLDNFGIELREVIINNLLDGIFYAQLICWDGSREVIIDSRTSDSIAMAVRFNCPIFTMENIMEEAGMLLDPEEEKKITMDRASKKVTKVKAFSDYSVDELNEMLEKVLSEEDYEQAAKIRDEINKRTES